MKDYRLAYDYSTGRLTLLSITEQTSDEQKPAYQFGYNALRLPDRRSKAQDHWGYYNSNIANTLVPPAWLSQPSADLSSSINYYYNGADRSPDTTRMQAGILEKIVYPTGGSTVFEYEPHDYLYEQRNRIKERFKTALRSAGVKATGACQLGSCDVAQHDGWQESEYFRIKEDDTQVTFDWRTGVYTDTDYFGAGRSPKIEVVDAQGELITGIAQKSGSGSFKKLLPAGRYKLRARAFWRDANNFDQATMIATWQEVTEVTFTKIISGGVRVKAVREYDEQNNAPIVRKYRYQMANGESSGVIYQEPEYVYRHSTFVNNNLGAVSLTETECDYYYRLARNVALTGLTQGSHIGYRRVVETQGENAQNGYTVYEFTSPYQYPDFIYNKPPFPPPSAQSYRTGLRKFAQQYDSEHTKVAQDTTTFVFQQFSIPALKVGFKGGIKGGIPDYLEKYDMGGYRLNLGYHQIEETQRKTFSTANDAYVEKQSTYQYDASLQNVVEQQTVSSEGQTLKTTYKYAQDFTDNTYGSNLLRSRHMYNQVLEQTVSVKEANQSDEETTQKIITQYNEVASQVVPKIITHYPTGSTSSGDAEQTQYEYDAYGDIAQVLSTDGIPTAYLWGYQHTLPVAQVVGALYEQVAPIVNLTALQTLDGEALHAELNKLRDQLPEAQVTTYTHDPLVGIASATDPSGRISIYHYDDLNRLQWIESEEGHVVQKLDYQYAEAIAVPEPEPEPEPPTPEPEPCSATLSVSLSGSARVTVGGSATFTATATGCGPFTYEWATTRGQVVSTTGNRATLEWNVCGPDEVIVTVTDANGSRRTTAKSVEIDDPSGDGCDGGDRDPRIVPQALPLQDTTAVDTTTVIDN